MTDPRVMRLLEQILESGGTPEEVCADSVDLLWEVREKLKRCRDVDAEIDAIFPPSGRGLEAGRQAASNAAANLPHIPGYDVESVLGRGGMGVVYKARQLKLGRPVALKMILGGAFAGASEFARFMHEAEAVAGLRHPHIVQVYDAGDLEGLPYFTMEYVEGGSLGQKLAGTPQPAREAAELVATLAGAVQAAHDAGIVHRDLKPGNVLLTADGTPKITDFGLARHFDRDDTVTLSGARVGTPSYMSPEQAAGKSSVVGPAADVYSLGAILYELLTGRPPFRAESATATVLQVIHQEPAPPSRLNAKVPRDLETLCLTCLRKDPRRRYASAASLADDLRRFLEGRPIQARPPRWAGRLSRWARREPAAAALVAATLALVALAVGGGFWVQRQRAATRAGDALSRLAAEAALSHARDLQNLGHWPEARAALAVAPSLVGTSAPEALRQRLRRALADADMVVRLEGVRLRLSEGANAQGRVSTAADQLYAETFGAYGIKLAQPDAGAAAAALVRSSDIRDILLVFLHDWLYWAPEANAARLRAVINEADDDPWRKAFRDARANNDLGKLAELARAPGAADQPPVLVSGLGGALLVDGRREEAWTLLREAQRRHPGDFWINFLLGVYLEQERPQEAIGYFRAAVAIRPGSNQAYARLSQVLREAGNPDEAIIALTKAVALHRSHDSVIELLKAQAPVGRMGEGRVVWARLLADNPPDHDTWNGYAQLCLYLGDVGEYRQARRRLLDRFGNGPGEWVVAERTALASLLLRDPGEDAGRVAAAADRAVAEWEKVLSATKPPKPDNPYVTFVAGLSAYRQHRTAEALPLLREAATKIVDRAGPRLALAMAQFDAGARAEARRTLAEALEVYNWQTSADDRLWVSHILRREAEALILPDVPPLSARGAETLEGGERLALVNVCESKGLYRTAARLLSDAFAADPAVADASTARCRERAASEADPSRRDKVLKEEYRYRAARDAALAGSGVGNDTADVGDAERTQWRDRARQWLAAGLTAGGGTQDGSPEVTRQMLTLWRADADLAQVRDPEALKKLPPQERDDWTVMWNDVGRAMGN